MKTDNVIPINGHDFLVVDGTGERVHLARRSDDGWSAASLCGRPWRCSSPGVPVPTCRACLRCVSVEPATPDTRLELVAGLAVIDLLARAEGVVRDVPGDQIDNLRAAIRSEAHRAGVRVTTHVSGPGDVYVWSDDVPTPDEQLREAVENFAALLEGRSVHITEYGVDWGTWSV